MRDYYTNLECLEYLFDSPANVLPYNQAVVLNSTVPSPALRREHNAICYHRVCEAVAAGNIRIAKVDTKQDLADIILQGLCLRVTCMV